jgi:hypothetical protein
MRQTLIAIVFALAGTASAQPVCSLTAADKQANALLSYDEFDQTGTLPSSWRALSKRGCEAMAADAAEDYLLHRTPMSEGARINILFHEAQSLAVAGREREAARLMAASKDLKQTPDADFDWNSYVEGSWAFLLKDRARLDEAVAVLSRSTEPGNVINAKVLRGLAKCFDRPYKQAYGDPVCRKP